MTQGNLLRFYLFFNFNSILSQQAET